MTGTERTPLDFDDVVDDHPLDEFKPKPKAPRPTKERQALGNYPSREVKETAKIETAEWKQLNLRVQASLEQRFKTIAKAKGLKHYALLQQALDAFEKQ